MPNTRLNITLPTHLVDDIKAIVEFIHSLTAASPGQGAPPRTEAQLREIDQKGQGGLAGVDTVRN